jgi:hypothetical protein
MAELPFSVGVYVSNHDLLLVEAFLNEFNDPAIFHLGAFGTPSGLSARAVLAPLLHAINFTNTYTNEKH